MECQSLVPEGQPDGDAEMSIWSDNDWMPCGSVHFNYPRSIIDSLWKPRKYRKRSGTFSVTPGKSPSISHCTIGRWHMYRINVIPWSQNVKKVTYDSQRSLEYPQWICVTNFTARNSKTWAGICSECAGVIMISLLGAYLWAFKPFKGLAYLMFWGLPETVYNSGVPR